MKRSVLIRFSSGGASDLVFVGVNLVPIMRAALGNVSLQRISSILRHSSGFRGVWNVGGWSDGETAIVGNVGCSERCTGGFAGLSSEETGIRWFGATSFLSGSRILSKYSRRYPKVDRKQVVEVKVGRSGLGPGSSRVRHGPNLAFKALNQIGLKDSTKAVVLASLLGDSTLQIVTGEYFGVLDMMFAF